ncbi:MAG: tetratricopeptide repeat protein [Bacteroidota bacterium]
MDEQGKYSSIEAYLLGQLSEGERQAFEERMAAEPELAQQVEQERKLLSGMAYFSQQQFKAELQAIHREVIEGEAVKPPPEGKKKPGLPWWLIALVALGLAALLFWWLQGPAPTPQQLYAAHYEVFELPSASRDPDNQAVQAQAYALYEQGQYQQALPLFEQLLENQTNNIPLQLAAGNCHLQLNQAQAALPYFARSLAADDLLYRDQARWYAGLTQLQLGLPEAARAYLQPLADDPSSSYQTQAQGILKALKN